MEHSVQLRQESGTQLHISPAKKVFRIFSRFFGMLSVRKMDEMAENHRSYR